MSPTTPQLVPPTTGQRATTREFLSVVFRRRWLILGLFAATTLTVFVVALSTPVLYISSARVMIKRGEKESALQPYIRVTNDWEGDLGNEMETVKSYPVLQRAREILEERARAGMKKLALDAGRVDAEVMGKSNVLAIGYEDRNPEVAQGVCDAVVTAYIEYREKARIPYPKRFFDTELAEASAQLEHWSEMRREFGNQAGVVDIAEQKRNLLGQLAMLEQRRTEVGSDLAEEQSQQRIMAQLRTRPEIDMPTIGQPYSNETALVEIKRKIVDQEGRLAELRERYREESPEIANAQATLATLKDMLKREVDARLEVSRSRVDVTKSRLSVIDRDIVRVRGELAGMPNKEMTLAQMDRQIETWRSRQKELIEKSDQARITENTAPLVSASVLNPAGAAVPRNTRDYVRLALAPAFSLVVGIGLAFFIDGLDLTVHTAGQAEEETELPVLAAITERRRRSGS